MEDKKLTGYPSIDKPWMKFYQKDTILSEVPECTVYQNLYNHNKDCPNDIALMYFGKKITYAQLFAEVEKAAKAFAAQGVKSGDNVALCVPATPETMYAILALNKIGANANMLNPTFTAQQLTDRINDTGAKLLVVVNELYSRVENVIPNTCVKTVISFSAVNSLGTIVKIIKKAKNIPGTIPWNKFISNAKHNKPVADASYQKDTPAIMVYSSGTTGASKGIQLTNDSVNNTICEGVQIGFPWERGDRWFSQIPIWFSTGICASTLVPLTYGITIILEPMYDFEVFYQHILKYKPNFMITACGLLDYLMMKQPKSEAYKEFKFLCAGGEYVAPSAEKKYNEWLRSNGNEYGFYKGYGMCECGGTVTASSPKCNPIGTAGLPTPNVVVSAFNPETNEELTYGQRGEIRVLTKGRMLGYYKNPEATAKYFWTDANGNVWCCTGDMGHVDEDGSIYVDGRINDSYVNEQGETIYLFDIERAILDVESVRQCKAVVSEIDGKQTHVAHTVFFNDKNTEEIIAQIQTVCKNKLPENHYPHLIKLHEDALPVSPSGKLNTVAMKQDTENLIFVE